MIDLHVHTPMCRHATGEMSEYVEAAMHVGVEVMAFTDHLALPEGYPEGYAMLPEELSLYAERVDEIARRSEHSGGPEILLGIEADWTDEAPRLVAEAVSRYPFDLVLGSVHMIDGWAFDDPERRAEYAAWTPVRLWDRYFGDIEAAAASGLYDAMAHPDLVKKFRFVPDGGVEAYHQRAAAAFADAGVAVEVNSAGLRKPCAEIYPAPGMLRACRVRGVPATMGSDAHCPAEVGSGLASVREHLLEAGYTSVMVFRDRVAEEVGL